MKNIIILIIPVLVALVVGACQPYDDTDPPTGGRSGLMIYTDSRTGCQYLAVLPGGLTPRLDASGKQICKP